MYLLRHTWTASHATVWGLEHMLCCVANPPGCCSVSACVLCEQEIHIAEIDGDVPEMSKKFFPALSVGFQDPRVKVHICDGIK